MRVTFFPPFPQTSGVKVTDEVIAVFNDMKVRKAFANEEEKRKRKKAILFCLSKDLKNIVLDEGKEILLGDLGTTVQDPYQHFVKMLPPEDCRYALYDATYETKETKKEDLVFIFWSEEGFTFYRWSLALWRCGGFNPSVLCVQGT